MADFGSNIGASSVYGREVGSGEAQVFGKTFSPTELALHMGDKKQQMIDKLGDINMRNLHLQQRQKEKTQAQQGKDLDFGDLKGWRKAHTDVLIKGQTDLIDKYSQIANKYPNGNIPPTDKEYIEWIKEKQLLELAKNKSEEEEKRYNASLKEFGELNDAEFDKDASKSQLDSWYQNATNVTNYHDILKQDLGSMDKVKLGDLQKDVIDKAKLDYQKSGKDDPTKKTSYEWVSKDRIKTYADEIMKDQDAIRVYEQGLKKGYWKDEEAFKKTVRERLELKYAPKYDETLHQKGIEKESGYGIGTWVDGKLITGTAVDDLQKTDINKEEDIDMPITGEQAIGFGKGQKFTLTGSMTGFNVKESNQEAFAENSTFEPSNMSIKNVYQPTDKKKTWAATISVPDKEGKMKPVYVSLKPGDPIPDEVYKWMQENKDKVKKGTGQDFNVDDIKQDSFVSGKVKDTDGNEKQMLIPTRTLSSQVYNSLNKEFKGSGEDILKSTGHLNYIQQQQYKKEAITEEEIAKRKAMGEKAKGEQKTTSANDEELIKKIPNYNSLSDAAKKIALAKAKREQSTK